MALEPSTPTARESLEAVLARALELRDQGASDWLDQACRHHPEWRESVRDAAMETDGLAECFAHPDAAGSAQGRVLAGRFRLGRRIGAGAMGVVHVADDLELVRSVAVKILRHGLTDPDESARRFLREAEAMASVQHGSVITIHDRGRTEDGEPFIVMELIDGISVDVWIEEARRRPMRAGADDAAWIRDELRLDTRGETNTWRLYVRWIADLASGLEVVHAAGVLHRDIKPSNILVRRDGRAVLLDFGVALLDGESTLTRGATSVGTPAYMPPEALVRGRRRGPASDVYSLTATLYHLLTLHAPYQGSPAEVLAAIATRDPKPAVRHCPNLPRDLQAILDRGLGRDPRSRYASAAALEADLRAFLDHRPVRARPVGPIARAWRAARRSNVARGVLSTLAIVALIATVVLALGWNDTRRDAAVFELSRHLPPNFTVVGATNRVFRYAEDRAAVQALLDTAVARARSTLPLRMLRASFLRDHGDGAGAARDMAAVATEVGSEFARELADRYSTTSASAGQISLADLPPRSKPVDRYLEAYHLLRAGDERAACALLDDQQLRSIPHAEELRLAFLPLDGLDSDTRQGAALRGFADTIRLETRLGGRTATTAHIAGRMLDVLSRYDEASRVLDEGIALAPRSHTIRINAGFAALGMGEHVRAREHFEVAIDLRPNYRKPLQDLIWVLVAQGEFDSALTRIDTASLDERPDNAQWKLLVKSGVEAHRALALRRAGDGDRASAAIERAKSLAANARALGPVKPSSDLALLDGLRSNDSEAVFVALAEHALSDPHNWWQLQSLLEHMPADPSPRAADALRRVLHALTQRLTSRELHSRPHGGSDG